MYSSSGCGRRPDKTRKNVTFKSYAVSAGYVFDTNWSHQLMVQALRICNTVSLGLNIQISLTSGSSRVGLES